jgi:RNA polymerase sigma-70 factor, ECF subfamily
LGQRSQLRSEAGPGDRAAPDSALRMELDPLLVRRAQAGHDLACRQLVMAYQSAVFSLLWRLLAPAGRENLVEDLAQETFLRVFRALPGFDLAGSARLSTWILTIATRLGIDELRRPRPELRSLSAAQDVPSPLSPERDAVARSQARQVEAAMARLGADQRAVLVLSVYFDLGQSEIAEVLGCEPGTVKSRLSRARRALRDATEWGQP